MANQQSGFPHPLYSKYVLGPTFDGAQTHLFDLMLTANRVHAVMLHESGVISHEDAVVLLTGLQKIQTEGADSFSYQPGIEDLFFAVEKRLIEYVGSEAGGNLQLARSRNDLGYGLTRMMIRENYLKLADYLLAFCKVLYQKSGEHLNTIMPGYTHTQPAQPTTFAHYLSGVLESTLRFCERLKFAYELDNLSPLGAAALTGTGFPINRQRSAELLGFDEIIHSSQDAIGAGDNLSDAAAWIASFGVFLSRMTKDFIFWCTRESGAFKVDSSFIQISSIMPQKRNPVVIEHLRARISRMIGLSQGLLIQCHNIPYGDTQDVEDEIEFFLINAFQTADDVLDLYAVVIETLQLNEEKLKEQAQAAYITVTELADTIVREKGLPFRQAHHAVSQLVQYGLENDLSIEQIPLEKLNEFIKESCGKPVELSEQVYRDALDVEKFIAKRTLPGGSSPEATAKVLQQHGEKIETWQNWLDERKRLLEDADAKLSAAEKEILK